MKILGKNIENRTILIILIILLVILAVYYIITTSPAQEDYYSVEEILRNKDSFIDSGTIIVRGYYDSNGPAIVSTPSDITGKPTLDLDPYGVENASDILRDGVKFDFTGVLIKVDVVGAPNSIVIFKATKIEIV